MAFKIQNWARASVSANEGIVQLKSGQPPVDAGYKVGCWREYNYFSSASVNPVVAADTLVAIAADNTYFAPVAYDLSVDDRITIAVTGAVSTTYRVTAITANPTTVTIVNP
jgi:hypothetical protein